MRNLLLAATLLLAVPALGQPCRLVGHVTGLGTRTIEYTYTRQGQPHTDSVRVVDDRFALPIVGGDDSMGRVLVRDAKAHDYIQQSLSLWVEPGTVTVTGQAGNLSRLTATGTPENDVLAAHERTVAARLVQPREHTQDSGLAVQRQTDVITCDFVRAHPAAQASA